MKKYLKLLSVSAVLLMGGLYYGCSDFLEVNPKGALDENVLATEAGAETLLIGAYALLDGTSNNITGWEGASSNWVYGSIVGGEANKGSDSGDQPAINPIMSYTADESNPYFNARWRVVYDGVVRSNAVLRILPKIQGGRPAALASMEAQARALRGHYHFKAKQMWNMVPYLDENTTDYYVPNDRDIWPEIEADLKFGYDNLPEAFPEIGRINKWVAGAMYAKALIFQKKFAEAKPIVEALIANGKKPNGQKFALLPNFGDNFDAVNGNSVESVFAWQYSVNDGSGAWNGGWGEVLNFPHTGGPGGCCGFFQPSHDFANSFRVNAQGFPLLDNSFSTPANRLVDDQGIAATAAFTPDQGLVDPRLDWSVGRRGIPYWDWGPHPGISWIRDQGYAGPYSPKKQVYKQEQTGTFTEVGNWTSGWTANNYKYIRYSDIILWAAEIEIEVGSLDQARQYINIIRNRAATGEPVTFDDGTPAANYLISEYPAGHPAFAGQEAARTALRMERKLELGMEGHRFFDLVRWGIAEQEINRFISVERPRRPLLYEGSVFQARHNYYPIPLIQIDLMRGTLTQNPGY
ncbi:RagB/SusD family nutrient uptake outer membrane protein [Aquiflexum sp.]|uniref:RagB/SusD family nutrient uptake outer membrane protein n=1 Tax=Aquiflexum sp. TaxID=1872584 RepID=UPI003593869E